MSRLLDLVGASTLTLTALLLILIVAAHLALRWWIQRRDRQPDPEPLPGKAGEIPLRRWVTRALVAMLPALVLLIWIHGLYVLLNLLLPRVTEPGYLGLAQLTLRWVYGISVIAAMYWLLLRLGRLIEAFLVSLVARAETSWDDLLLPLAGHAVRLTLPLLAIILGAPALSISPAMTEVVGNLTSLLLIGVVAVILFRLVNAAAELILRHRIEVEDSLRARAIRTQVLVLKKVVITLIGLFTLASMLMVFDSVRQFGASILASAGLAGIVLGFAAQRSLATLLAGFQVAVTQPIRVDDAVLVENEMGHVEDITLTYVVIRLWDLRRLVLPVSYFIEQPFQNWSRTSTGLIGSVFLHVDYTLPVEALRTELTKVLEASPLWDGKVNVLHVTDAKEHTLQLRILASAADAGQAWDLRCEVREKLIGFIQQHYPESLPRMREVQMQETDAPTPPGRALP